jgi:hypothetical protein
MFEKVLDPEVLKSGCGIAAMIYGAATAAILITAVVAKNPSLRNDSKIVVPILAIVTVALALIDLEFPRASQTLLPILYPSIVLALGLAGVALIALAVRALKHRATRIVALIAAPLPIAVSAVLVLIAYLLAHSRFCC